MLNKFQSDPNAWTRLLNGLVLAGFIGITGFFLLTEHRAHLYGALPYLLVVVCLGLLVIVWRVARNSGPSFRASEQPRGNSKKGGTST